jgi:hypothetical protein
VDAGGRPRTVRGRSDRVRVVESDLARWLRDEEAAGSNPATPTQVTGHSHSGKWPFPMPSETSVWMFI